MSIIRIHLKISEQTSKSGFFPSRLVGIQDSGFSKKIGRILTKSGWVDQGSQIRQNCSDDTPEVKEGVTLTPEIFGNKQGATLTLGSITSRSSGK